MVILALFIGLLFFDLKVWVVALTMMGSGFLSAIYIIIALFYFFPVYYLFQFSSKWKLSSNDNDLINSSFEYLKSHYKFIRF
jgi:hypothetical protein